MCFSQNQGFARAFGQIALYAYWRGWPVWRIDLLLLALVGSADAHAAGPANPGRFELAEPADLDEIAACGDSSGNAALRSLYAGFFSRNHRCAVVRSGNGVVGAMWAFQRDYIITI